MMGNMAQPTLPAEGGCRCGKLRFRVTEQPVMTLACHCRGCQHMSASAFSLTAMIPETSFAVTADEPVIGGIHGDQGRHHHCDWCKGWVFTTLTPSQGFVNVRATLFDEVAWFTPFAETQTAEKLAWAELPVRHSFQRWPKLQQFPMLMAEFAASA